VFLNAFVGSNFNPDEKYKLGWFVVGLLGIFIGTHLTNILGTTICGLIKSAKEKIAKWKNKNKEIDSQWPKTKEVEVKEKPN
jgi:hypothetical protein